MSDKSALFATPKPRSKHVAVDTFQPIATINTTPLIDVMLVLLIMMIITIPISTHKVPLDLPAPTPVFREPAPAHRLEVTEAGRMIWDGAPLAESELVGRLHALASDPAEPDLHIAPASEARFERIDEILAEVKKAGITRLGFVGNQAFVEALDPR
jgi:biopolymer transport protein ExbD